MTDYKRYLIIITISLGCYSCQYIDNQIPSKKKLIEKELKAINWNEVDEYPTVQDCELLEDKVEQKKCFFEFLSAQIQDKLAVPPLLILYPELDTIEVKITIFADSRLEFEPLFPKDSIAFDSIKIDSILKTRLVDFPKIKPAIKRGLPVKTQFVLPVVLKFNKK